jgi:hypothetical protein
VHLLKIIMQSHSIPTLYYLRFAVASGQVAPGIYDTEVVFPETPNTGGQPGYLRYRYASANIYFATH